jgi:hypothetical protein
MAKNPKSSRPHMPGYGIAPSRKGLLLWKWAADRLSKSHNYWIATTRADGRPHCVGVWGVWFAGRFYFSSGRESVKSRNLLGQPYCVICTENAAQPVVLEGIARVMTEPPNFRLRAAYQQKYKYDLDPAMGPIFVLEPKVAFGFVEYQMQKTATRWRF